MRASSSEEGRSTRDGVRIQLMSGYLQFDGDPRSVWAVYADPSGPTAARVSLNFGSWTKNLDEEQLAEILEKLRNVDSLAPYLETIEPPNFNTYPSVPIRVLAKDDAVATIVNALDPFVSAM